MSKNDKTINDLKIKISRSLDKITKNDMNGIASFIEKIVRVRTRLGYGVKKESGEKYRFAELAGKKDNTSTVYQRNLKKKRGELSSLTTPKKSNLTMTGQMLDSIKWTIDKLKIRLFIGSNKRNDGKNTNANIAEYVSAKRPFFNISKSEEKQIKREVEKIVKKKLG